MIGVSPAYFISRFGERFSPQEVASGLAEVAELGYDSFQLEVFHADTLDLWAGEGARIVEAAARSHGLRVSQFVAHFMLHAFESPEAILADDRQDAAAKICEIVSRFPECQVVTIPLGAFSFAGGSIAARASGNGRTIVSGPAGAIEAGATDANGRVRDAGAAPSQRTPVDFELLRARYLGKIGDFVEPLERRGLSCAIELVPGAFVSGSDGLLKLFSDLDSTALGYNFDTGHACACKEVVALVPFKFRSRIFGTHLCDNFGNENLKLCPGDGGIAWAQVFRSLQAVGYSGSLDVEIRCEPERVRREYARAVRFLRENAHDIIGNQIVNNDVADPQSKEKRA